MILILNQGVTSLTFLVKESVCLHQSAGHSSAKAESDCLFIDPHLSTFIVSSLSTQNWGSDIKA